VLTENRLKRVYGVIFPKKGDSDEYAHFVFKAVDRNRDGYICFEDIAETYSILSRGSTQEKLEWVFNFYDINRSKRVTRLDMLKVATSFYDLFDPDHPVDVFGLVNAAFMVGL
jgi:Ca2+-binding EF-hand superfamily protein